MKKIPFFFHFRNVLGIVKPLFPDTKVDRIIFIASAKFEKFPEELMKSVKFLALEGSRGNTSLKK